MRECQKRPIIRQKRPIIRQKRPTNTSIPEVCGGVLAREVGEAVAREVGEAGSAG